MKVPVLNKYIKSKNTFVERKLPNPGRLFVKKGDKVNSFDQIGETTYIKEREEITYTGKVLRSVGDRVYSGDVIAVGKKYLIKKLEYKTTISGRIKEIDTKNKKVTIEGLSKRFTLISGVSGEVMETLNEQSVLIKTKAMLAKVVAGSGKEVAGQLLVLGDGSSNTVEENAVTNAVLGKIVVARLMGLSAIKKAQALGAIGFILGGVEYLDFKKLVQEEVSLLVVEGFGSFPINSYFFDYLKTIQDKFCILRTYENMFLVPEEENFGIDVQSPDFRYFEKEVKVGDLVQVFRRSHYTQVGKIVEIGDETLKVDLSGSILELHPDEVGLLS